MTVKDCITYIRSGKSFSATVVTYDAARKIGGELFEFEGVRAVTDNPSKKAGTGGEIKSVAPNHGDNYTINVRLVVAGVATDLVRKIHPPLLVKFNNDVVIQ